MKTFHTILTVLFWVAIAFGLIPTMKIFSTIPSNATFLNVIAISMGNLLAFAIIPGIIWVIRHFVGKNIEEEKK